MIRLVEACALLLLAGFAVAQDAPVNSAVSSLQARRMFVKALDPSGRLESQFVAAGDICGVSGISCNAQNSVTKISLQSRALRGQIPDDQAVWNEFPDLENLDLSNNNLVGRIPTAIARSRKLKSVILANNKLTGQLPTFVIAEDTDFFQSVEVIDFSDNLIGGKLLWNWSSLQNVRRIDLSNNNIRGNFPTSWSKSNRLPNLKVLDVSNNGRDLCTEAKPDFVISCGAAPPSPLPLGVPPLPLSVGVFGEQLGTDGLPVLGPNGELLAPDNQPLLGPNGEILGTDGQPILGPNGELLGPDGKPILGPNGEILGPDGKPILGPNGEILGSDGEPLLGPDNLPIVPDVVEPEMSFAFFSLQFAESKEELDAKTPGILAVLEGFSAPKPLKFLRNELVDPTPAATSRKLLQAGDVGPRSFGYYYIENASLEDLVKVNREWDQTQTALKSKDVAVLDPVSNADVTVASVVGCKDDDISTSTLVLAIITGILAAILCSLCLAFLLCRKRHNHDETPSHNVKSVAKPVSPHSKPHSNSSDTRGFGNPTNDGDGTSVFKQNSSTSPGESESEHEQSAVTLANGVMPLKESPRDKLVPAPSTLLPAMEEPHSEAGPTLMMSPLTERSNENDTFSDALSQQDNISSERDTYTFPPPSTTSTYASPTISSAANKSGSGSGTRSSQPTVDSHYNTMDGEYNPLLDHQNVQISTWDDMSANLSNAGSQQQLSHAPELLGTESVDYPSEYSNKNRTLLTQDASMFSSMSQPLGQPSQPGQGDLDHLTTLGLAPDVHMHGSTMNTQDLIDGQPSSGKSLPATAFHTNDNSAQELQSQASFEYMGLVQPARPAPAGNMDASLGGGSLRAVQPQYDDFMPSSDDTAVNHLQMMNRPHGDMASSDLAKQTPTMPQKPTLDDGDASDGLFSPSQADVPPQQPVAMTQSMMSSMGILPIMHEENSVDLQESPNTASGGPSTNRSLAPEGDFFNGSAQLSAPMQLQTMMDSHNSDDKVNFPEPAPSVGITRIRSLADNLPDGADLLGTDTDSNLGSRMSANAREQTWIVNQFASGHDASAYR